MSDWQPMTMTFCAESIYKGITICHTFDAATEDDAQKIADDNGWIIVGILEDVELVEDELVALIESQDAILH